MDKVTKEQQLATDLSKTRYPNTIVQLVNGEVAIDELDGRTLRPLKRLGLVKTRTNGDGEEKVVGVNALGKKVAALM